MSLVDYASSSDDENDTVPPHPQQQQQQEEEDEVQIPQQDPSPSTTPPTTLSNPHPPRVPLSKLPDASMLLNSQSIPTSSGTDHASLVAAAVNSRKRESNTQPLSSLPRGKVPRGSLPHSKNIPDTGGGLLLPPQLRGRSNIVTEDIGKLFVKKQSEPSSQ